MSFPWQEHFPMLAQTMNGKRLAYLDSAATALKPLQVVRAMEDYLTAHTSSVHRGIYKLSENNTTHFERVREQVRAFLNAPAREEIIFTRGTTEALNLIAQSWGRAFLKEGDEILLTELEHHANIVPWWQLAQEKKLSLKVLPILPDGQLDLSKLPELLTARTKVVSFTLVSNTLGIKTPAKQIIDAAKAVGALVVLDAAQAAPHFPLDVQTLGADFLAFSAHKVYGPNGVGVLWGRQELLEEMPPWQGGGNMIGTVTFEQITWNKLPEKFEPGTPAIAEVMGLGAALDFIKQASWQEIETQDQKLLKLATNALGSLKGVRICGTGDKIATFALDVAGVHPQDLGSVLDKEGVAIRTGHHCTQPLLKRFGVTALARASFGPYNSETDVNQLVRAIEKAQTLFL